MIILDIAPLGFPWQTQDPFLFCAYHKDAYPEGNKDLGLDAKHLAGRNIGQDFRIKDGFRTYHGSQIPGFSYHPHRGFETITINQEGVVDHFDSLGASGRFRAGDVQWMTAGAGLQHSEMFPMVHEDQPNPLEIFQIWLNLPKKNKMVPPHFKMLWKEQVPFIKEEDSNGKITEIQLVAGNYKNESAATPPPDSWAATDGHNVRVMVVTIPAGGAWVLPKLVLRVTVMFIFIKEPK